MMDLPLLPTHLMHVKTHSAILTFFSYLSL